MEKKQLEYLLHRIDILERQVKHLESRHTLVEYFTVQEVADSLKVTPATLVRKIHEGEIKAIRTGKEYRIAKPEVDQYILSLTLETKE